MDIYVLGVSYKRTPIELREKFNITDDSKRLLEQKLLEFEFIKEVVLLCTCNRTEIYAFCAPNSPCIDTLEKLLCEFANVPMYEAKKYFYFYTGKNAAKHLFEVASGLDSMLAGEDQILKQIKDTAQNSFSNKHSGKILNTLFRYSVTSAKKVKTITSISSNATSLTSLSVRTAQDFFCGELKNKSALVIGAGQTGVSAVKHLLDRNVSRVYITNRTHEYAHAISSAEKNVYTIEYSKRYDVMDEVDLIISCTSSPHYTVTKDILDKTLKSFKPRLLIDLAVPRDIDPDVKTIDGVHYINIDSIGEIIKKNLDIRTSVSLDAKEIIKEYLQEFEKWYSLNKSVYLLKKVRKISQFLVDERVSRTLPKMKNSKHADVLSRAIDATAKDFLNTFIYGIKEKCSGAEIEQFFDIMGKVFDDNRFITPAIEKGAQVRVKIRVGTRDSALALSQTQIIIDKIKEIEPQIDIEIVKIKTTGDRILDTTLDKIGGKGLFIKELEQAILDSEIDIAVHSLKDVPAKIADTLQISCFSERKSAHDVLISRHAHVSELNPNPLIGTSSARREMQIKLLRPDASVAPIRGNVTTRIRKLVEGQFDAIILAAAGLERLSIDSIEGYHITHLSTEDMLPAIGQGIICVETRGDGSCKNNSDNILHSILSQINCTESEIVAKCERSVMECLGGSCFTPLAAYALTNGDSIVLSGFLGSEDKQKYVHAKITGRHEDYIDIGCQMASTLKSKLAKR